MSSRSDSSIGEREIEGNIKKLKETHTKIAKNQARVWLIRSLADRNLSLRDIYSFLYKQAKLRSQYDQVDKQTAVSAARAKLKDLRLELTSLFKKKKHQEK